MNRKWLLGAVVLATSSGACSSGAKLPDVARAALDGAERLELWSLDPTLRETPAADGFHGWRALGRVTVEDAAERARLVDALAKGVAGNDGVVAACFNPRHGVRAVHDGKTVDLVICFECLQVQMFVDASASEGFLTTSAPQPSFDRVLRAAGVPLAADGPGSAGR